MKKTVAQILLGLGLAASLSCKKIQNEDFELSASSTNLTLIDAKGFSCTALTMIIPTADINPIMTTLQSMTINWKGKSPLAIQYVKFIFEGGGLAKPYSVTFSGTELNLIWMAQIATPAVIPAETTATSKCAFSIGAIPVQKENSAFGTGRVIVYGTTENGTKPAVATAFFSYSYLGNE